MKKFKTRAILLFCCFWQLLSAQSFVVEAGSDLKQKPSSPYISNSSDILSTAEKGQMGSILSPLEDSTTVQTDSVREVYATQECGYRASRNHAEMDRNRLLILALLFSCCLVCLVILLLIVRSGNAVKK